MNSLSFLSRKYFLWQTWMLRQVQRKTKLTTWQGIYKTRVKVHVVGLNFWQVFYSSRAFQEKQCEGISAKYSNTFAYTCSSYLEKHSNWTIQCKRFLQATKYYGHSNHVPAKFTWSKVLSRHLCVIAAPDVRTNPTLNVDRLCSKQWGEKKILLAWLRSTTTCTTCKLHFKPW